MLLLYTWITLHQAHSVFNLTLAETDTVSVDSSAGGLLEGMCLDGDTLAPMETDEPSTSDPKAKSKLTPAMATRIKQIKPLLSGEKRFKMLSHSFIYTSHFLNK